MIGRNYAEAFGPRDPRVIFVSYPHYSKQMASEMSVDAFVLSDSPCGLIAFQAKAVCP
jgi:hypothetical protein